MCLLFTIILRLGSACRGFYEFLSGSVCGAGSSHSAVKWRRALVFFFNFQFAMCETQSGRERSLRSRVAGARGRQPRTTGAVRLTQSTGTRAAPRTACDRNTADCSVPFSLMTINIISYALFSLSYHSS